MSEKTESPKPSAVGSNLSAGLDPNRADYIRRLESTINALSGLSPWLSHHMNCLGPTYGAENVCECGLSNALAAVAIVRAV